MAFSAGVTAFVSGVSRFSAAVDKAGGALGSVGKIVKAVEDGYQTVTNQVKSQIAPAVGIHNAKDSLGIKANQFQALSAGLKADTNQSFAFLSNLSSGLSNPDSKLNKTMTGLGLQFEAKDGEDMFSATNRFQDFFTGAGANQQQAIMSSLGVKNPALMAAFNDDAQGFRDRGKDFLSGKLGYSESGVGAAAGLFANQQRAQNQLNQTDVVRNEAALPGAGRAYEIVANELSNNLDQNLSGFKEIGQRIGQGFDSGALGLLADTHIDVKKKSEDFLSALGPLFDKISDFVSKQEPPKESKERKNLEAGIADDKQKIADKEREISEALPSAKLSAGQARIEIDQFNKLIAGKDAELAKLNEVELPMASLNTMPPQTGPNGPPNGSVATQNNTINNNVSIAASSDEHIAQVVQRVIDRTVRTAIDQIPAPSFSEF
ncbi:hypothetical protein N9K16_01625 [Alphaproteobacteria bacterium]|nr:hypothetical protein [Alphaproteobacteria bacterium]